MYQVKVTKSLRFPDGTTAREESHTEKVNHERHALNLAIKIARQENVEWVEIEDVKGRFKARAAHAADGTVHKSLESRRSNRYRKMRFGRRRNSSVGCLVLICLVVLGVLGRAASMPAPSQDTGFVAKLIVVVLAAPVFVWIYLRKRR
ncbi:MAG TPA: hypothetical protein VGR03_03710 [Candidatus Acidoferrum sp.]|nr:hypothetical protein [Candidatus Acidoferrum sp.]